jgi:hypothetical protein
VTAIGALTPRRRSTVCGNVARVKTYRRPWLRTDAELADDTGCVVLRFVGRSDLPGIVVGRRLRAEGTPSSQDGQIVILNPIYAFEADA